MERSLLITAREDTDDKWSLEDLAGELKDLAKTANTEIICQESFNLARVNPKYYIGSGHVRGIAELIRRYDIDVAIFNKNLTGSQQRNVEDVFGCKTIDKTQLILDIFAKRAKSNEGKLQVELAQLQYMLPRLAGKGIMLSRLGGGVGTLGPGEQKLEIDRRRIRSRIDRLKRKLTAVAKQHALQRKQRKRHAILTAAFVGYTNAGKSTLFNALTRSDAIVRDKLFSTLDPLVRKFELPSKQKILLSDTVGFLNDLPHNLIKSFETTLEEVCHADFLIHVVDVSSPLYKEKEKAVDEILETLGANQKNIIKVYNKKDLIDDPVYLGIVAQESKGAVFVSAKERSGFDQVIQRIEKLIKDRYRNIKLLIPYKDMKYNVFFHENSRILTEKHREDGIFMQVIVNKELMNEFPRKYIKS